MSHQKCVLNMLVICQCNLEMHQSTGQGLELATFIYVLLMYTCFLYIMYYCKLEHRSHWPLTNFSYLIRQAYERLHNNEPITVKAWWLGQHKML